MFRKADPTRRIPTYLQAHTKENIIWQLKMTFLVCGAMWAWDEYQFRKSQKLHHSR